MNDLEVKLPEGYEFTGGFRPPTVGEYFVNSGLNIERRACDVFLGDRHIVKRVKPRAELGSYFYYIEILDDDFRVLTAMEQCVPFDDKMYESNNYFLTREEATSKLAKIKEIMEEREDV